jgi:hypothetical protein
MPRFCPRSSSWLSTTTRVRSNFAYLRPQSRRPHLRQLPAQRLHRSSPRGMLQCQLRGAMTQGQRDQGVVAFDIQIEFQLFAPRTAVAHQSAAGGTGALLGVIQSIVQFAQRIQTLTEHRLVRPVAGVGAVQQRHMSRLAHQSRQSHHPQIAALAFGMAAPRQFSRVVVAICVSKLVVSNASTSVDNSNRRVAARAISICAFSSCHR